MTTSRQIAHARLPLVLRHVLYNLRGGFLVRPLLIALFLGALGATLAWLEAEAPWLSAPPGAQLREAPQAS